MLNLGSTAQFKGLFLFSVLFFFSNNYLFCQNRDDSKELILNTKEHLDRITGMNPTLYNGLLYKTSYPIRIEGDQYFINNKYLKGEISIRGVKYKDIDLNFDIDKQVLLLKYLSSRDVYNIIEVSTAWLEGFTLGNFRFVLYGTPKVAKRFYQVLGNDSILLFYFWKKELKFQADYVGTVKYYFNLIKEQNVYINNSLYKFYNNKSFVRLFDKKQQSLIKDYIKSNRINVKKASDQTMEELINYCSKMSTI